ncbi:uncharacterized protein B0I36DRAFT_361036 [Microdochium trichocladiopsis]|uniref:Altered inheritance of mitochondria protein 6 n=1 Tax=Microdochium trichocladiopsis TaxID=1682393 RepID=A0A9P8Y9U8_9PEZI|nr:uncharacterized protein B0I36DRAFT_361036 [Microdochium trichocladiopsis]KAH7035704.1 hypothetical protein B0I36DRAFT_361036 [Microdochium trichocladiopsis]
MTAAHFAAVSLAAPLVRDEVLVAAPNEAREARTVEPRATNDISSCGGRWMPRDDVTIGSGTDVRPGFDSAVDRFCSAVNGKTVPAGGYLSMVTEVFLNGGKTPSQYGVLGFLHLEVHNKISSNHVINIDSCKQYLKALSVSGGKCSGATNKDSKGGTWQVGNEEVSYHAIGEDVPSQQDALNKLWTNGALKVQGVSKGSGPSLSPWPFSSIAKIKPAPCHSHNDYDQSIPLWAALSAGCLTVEADVWWSFNSLLLGHILPTLGRTFKGQYVDPLKAIIDYNNGNKAGGSIGVYPAAPSQTFVLFVDFKTSDAQTLDQVVAALQPLRDAGYLSYYDDAAKKFVSRQVTAVASGSADFGRIRDRNGVPNADLFFDAKVDYWDNAFTTANSYYASADFKDAIGNPSNVDPFNGAMRDKVVAQASQAHAAGLKVRYYNLPGEWIWEALAAAGVDRLNTDDLYNTARIPRL